MTYGAEVRNQFNEIALDFGSCFFIKEQGVTKTAVQAGLTRLDNVFGSFIGPLTQEVFLQTVRRPDEYAYPHFTTNATSVIFNARDPGSRLPAPLYDVSSMVFYQVGSIGLAHHSENTVSPPWSTSGTPQHGMFAMCLPMNNIPLPYLRVDRLLPSGLSGNYGMQIRNASGDVTFDSRANFLSISEVLFVPRSTIQNILDNGATVDLALRTPVPNCYLAAPNHNSFLFQGGAAERYRHVAITQLNSVALRLSRYLHGPFLSNNQGFGINNDLIIIVARNPFA